MRALAQEINANNVQTYRIMAKKDKLLVDTLARIKKEYEETITSGGTDGVHALIRSQKLIKHLHEYIKTELVSHGIHPSKIYPPPNASKPELKMTGFLKKKDQDISVLPKPPKEEIVEEGVLIGEKDSVGKELMNKSISINIRSQLSSLGKNFDTLFERTFAEALNLHLRAPKLIMGEVYMVPYMAYDPDTTKNRRIAWKESLPVKYIPAFRMLNNRESEENDKYKYERLCFLIIDFRKKTPEVIDSLKPFIDDELIDSKNANKFSLTGLSILNFISDILKIYEKRHGSLESLRKGPFTF